VLRLLWIPIALALLAGCGSAAQGESRMTIVATTTQVADFARHVAGPSADVVQILQPNTDPHDYEVRPDDVKAIAGADVVIRSGGEVDAWLDDAIAASGTDARVVTLSDKVPLQDDDPHWWQDPRNAVIAVHEIEAALHRKAPRYVSELERLDRATAGCIGKLPRSERKLVTTHDALAYYARRYGLEVIGTVIPSLSTEAQPSAGDTANLIRTIRQTGVKAIFPESSVNPKVEQAVARETGATIGRALWADTLGPEGSDGATYVESIRANTAAIVGGLSGGTVHC
jgi:zinc/manganese transport system substrate-binding protein